MNHDNAPTLEAVVVSPYATRLASVSNDGTRVGGTDNHGAAVSLPTEVLIAETISAEDATQLVEDFETIGLTAELREVSPRRSMDDLAWFVLAALPLQPFLNKLAEEFATDAYERLKTFATGLFHRRRSSTVPRRLLILQDATTGVQVVLEPDLPPESYQQLLGFDLSTIRRGPLHYDLRRGQWRSELDEADKAASQPPPQGS